MKKLVPYFLSVAIIVVFIYLGIVLKESVFFSYDMPRVGLKVQDYLRDGTYLTSQYFFSESSWLNVAWGPALIFFYAILIKIYPDPLFTSYLLTVINSLGVLAIIFLGWRNFSPRLGIIAGALLAFNPYLFTYARIIYQPSPLTFFIPIAMFFHFSALKLKKIALVSLPIIWVIMFQIYIPALAFILTSIIFLLFQLPKKAYKYLVIGAMLSMFFLIPSIKFYNENPHYISRFFDAPNHFNPREKNIIERSKNVLLSYIQIPVGGMFKWQTGSSYVDFIDSKIQYYPFVTRILIGIFIISLIWNLFSSIYYRDAKRGVVLAWSLCAFWYLNVLWTIDLVPRYFLISLPPSMLLISIFISDIIDISKKINWLKYLLFSVPILITIYWIFFNIQYNSFIKNYNYPYGWFSDIAETPYVYIKDSIEWVLNDSLKNNCKPILSNDLNNHNFVLWMETEYPWKYVYNMQTVINENSNNCYYTIYHNHIVKDLKTNKFMQFGPFVAFRNN